MNVSDQVDALQQRAAELKSSFDAARTGSGPPRPARGIPQELNRAGHQGQRSNIGEAGDDLPGRARGQRDGVRSQRHPG